MSTEFQDMTAPETTEHEAEAPEAADAAEPTETTDAAPAEPGAPKPRALARKAERDALRARDRLAKAEAAEQRASAMMAEVAELRALAQKLQSDDPFQRAEAARVDVSELARRAAEEATPEAATKKIVEERLREQEQRHARAQQETREREFVSEAGRSELLGALLKADDDDGEPVLTRHELLAQGYRVAAKLNASLAAQGAGRPCTNAEIFAALESKYRKRFAVQAAPEQAPAKPAAAKPVNGAAGARNAAGPKIAPRTKQEIAARLAELMAQENLQ